MINIGANQSLKIPILNQNLTSMLFPKAAKQDLRTFNIKNQFLQFIWSSKLKAIRSDAIANKVESLR